MSQPHLWAWSSWSPTKSYHGVIRSSRSRSNPQIQVTGAEKNMEWIGIVRDLSIQICGMYETNQRFFCINMSPWGVEGTSVQNFLKINRDQSWNVTESWWLDVIGVFCEFIWRPYHIALKLSLAHSMSSTLLPRVIFHCSTWARV